MRSKKVEGLDIPWTALTLGCLQIAPSEGWGDRCSAADADRVVKTALEGGIRAFDTAEGYGDGESERRLGKALGSRKNEVLIVSKIWPDAELTLEAYQSRLEGTLKALGRDYVDVYMVHWPGMYLDTMVKTGKMCDIMAALKESGKARTVGISNFRARDIGLMQSASSLFTVNQIPYNLLQREYEGEHLQKCQKDGIGYMAYSPSARGLLAGRFDEEALNTPARREYYLYRQPYFYDSKIVRHTVNEMAREIDTAPINVALAWVIQQENITTAVIGSSKVDQVKEFCAAGDLTLTPAQLHRLNEASAVFHSAGGTRV
ncbi:MAG: aldo/keto reductase [Nitrospinaceae bacterium]|nr:aldo/keto reductase [Nitrospinaceae bacterium]NIR57744.1 aldo/keto reductase [Nitrospinaceae bacterium]NIS88204.1 aldo/keto reductase [Nitrospinaceae bacterium]NIT85088.1 aldo/keto reductase [Nitrospinaceae bacterium]NIU47243.1 aldo/keto reductase [Nitrospinaceae bacterium]